jgi:stalled ribosome alternative rescue factor ArfA
MKKRKSKQKRNPIARTLTHSLFRQRMVKPKKGKGAYRRRFKYKNEVTPFSFLRRLRSPQAAACF